MIAHAANVYNHPVILSQQRPALPNTKVMPYNSAHHCVVEVENFLFVLGGEDQWNPNGGVHNGEYVPWLYCYDPVMDVWARKQDMNTKRAIHTLAVMNDRLYAIGGNHLKGCLQVVYDLLLSRKGNLD
ncbi:hypothetical protein ACRRTK_020461 [Alexandromys fortis]